MSKIGIVLSGGGIRGFAHLGLLQVLDELGIKPYAVSGVSSGAIVGVMYAAGHKPQEILSFMKSNLYFNWSSFRLNRGGFFSMQPLADSLQEKIPHNSFEDLLMPFFATATDFTKNETLTFSHGPLHQAIIASASVPVIFEPVIFGNSLLMDGGLLNNFPLEPLENICNKFVGSYVNNIQPEKTSTKAIGKAHLMERCFHMAIANSVYVKKKYCHVFLEPLLSEFGMFDRKKADIIFEIGYKTALAHKKELLNLLT